MGRLEENKAGGKEEKNDRQWIILNYSYVGTGTMKCSENCWTMQGRGKRVRKRKEGVRLIKI